MEPLKLFMMLVGCTPAGRHTEQHDVFFSIGTQLKDIVPEIKAFWPEANGKMHLDAWRQVSQEGAYDITVYNRQDAIPSGAADAKIFFINLGGYKPGDFEEFHYKMLVTAKNKGAAISEAKKTAFYRHVGFEGAPSHVDDKFGVDVDDLYEITDILPPGIKEKYVVVLTATGERKPDAVHLGYMKIDEL